MESIYGMCGLECSDCPALIAYKNDDQELREKTAKQWSEWYKSDIKPEDVNCVGCMEEGEPKVGHCSECDVRLCGLKEEIKTCAICNDYPCKTLDKFQEFLPPEAKENLEKLRAQ